jgi:Zn finger protein HypA/HybF involved in hydrogenase expression
MQKLSISDEKTLFDNAKFIIPMGSDNRPSQKVECDSCPWSGFEADLDVRELNNGEDAECCPQCGELSISHLGFDY